MTDRRWTVHPLMEELKVKAQQQGLWNLFIPADMAQKFQHLLPSQAQGVDALLSGPGLTNLVGFCLQLPHACIVHWLVITFHASQSQAVSGANLIQHWVSTMCINSNDPSTMMQPPQESLPVAYVSFPRVHALCY